MCADALNKCEADGMFKNFVWTNPDYTLTSAKQDHEKKRASGRKKVGIRAPVMEMAQQYSDLIRTEMAQQYSDLIRTDLVESRTRVDTFLT